MLINYDRDKYLSEFSHKTLQDRYLIAGENSPQDAFARAAKAFSDDDAHAQRLYDYASKLWFMFSTPVLSNGGTTRGLPVLAVFLIMLRIADRESPDTTLKNRFPF